MLRKVGSFALVVAVVSLLAPRCAADDPLAIILKRDGYAVSLDLKFSKKKQNSLQQVLSSLDEGPNAYATGFIVGDGLVMTAYHAVSGDLSVNKKVLLGFAPKDQLRVEAYVGDCQATVLKVDEAADLALLRVCPSRKQIRAPAFQTSLGKDEKLLLIARPNGDKAVRRGVFHGPYMFRGQQYLSAKIDGGDGYSGGPVYNDKGELVGVFCGYDSSQRLAVISPGIKAQKLLEDYLSSPGP